MKRKYLIYIFAFICLLLSSCKNGYGKNRTYTVSFITGTDVVIPSQTIIKGEKVVKPDKLERDEYNFLGWFVNNKKWSFYEHVVSKNITLVAKWQINQYTLTFKDYEGNIIKTLTQDYNSSFTIEEPKKDGYLFAGWDKTVPSKIPAQDTTYTAFFIPYYQEGNYSIIELGKYPQTVVDDLALITELSAIKLVNDHGYIEYNGNEYKKVKATPYSSTSTFNNNEVLVDDKIYYFKVEPLKWRVLTNNDGTYKLMMNQAFDNPSFYPNDELRTINGKTIYPNNYEYSNIRAWLNGYDGSSYNIKNYLGRGFFDMAFNEREQQLIQTTFIDNSISSNNNEPTDYFCNDTNDKIYLLSVTDLTNPLYGYSVDDKSEISISDYVIAKGAYYVHTFDYRRGPIMTTRTPSTLQDLIIDYYGNIINISMRPVIYYEAVCSAPGLTIKLSK